MAYRVLGEPGKLVVYYEGNRHGAGNLQTLADRALNAYGRMAMTYPTIARAVLDAELFEAVGEVGTEGHYEIDAAAPALQAWVAHDPNLMGQPAAHVLRYRMR